MIRRNAAVLILTLVAAGCYHATIDTGLPPSTQTIDIPWAHGFLEGLVPPDTVEAAGDCPNGVSRVETKLSVLNLIAGGLTFGIYAPMHITVTCAASGGMAAGAGEVIEAGSSAPEDVSKAFADAAIRSWEQLGGPVYVSVPMD